MSWQALGAESPTVACDLMSKILNSENFEELLEAFGTQIFSISGVEGCMVNLLEASSQTLMTVYLRLPEEFTGVQNSYRGFQYPLDQRDIHVEVFKSGSFEIVLAQQLGKYAESTRLRFERWKMHSLLVMPLSVKLTDGPPRRIGVVSVFSRHLVLDAATEQRVEALGTLYSNFIQIYWNYTQAIERAKAVEVMYEEVHEFMSYITEMNSLTAVDQVFAAIGHEFISRFHFDMVNILLAKDSQLPIVHTSFSEPYQHVAARWEPFREATIYSLDVRDGQSAMVFENNRSFMIDDVSKVMHLPMAEKDKAGLMLLGTVRTFIIVPIRLKNEVIGIMWLLTLREPVSPPKADMALIELLSAFISTAIRNAQAHTIVEQQKEKIERLNQELQDKVVMLDQVARRDRLTGLNNFGSFEEELKRRTSEYARTAQDGPLSVILVDIDNFKPFNDNYGHPAGNQVLHAIGTRIQESVRDMDFVARYGGEEFVVLLPQCDVKGAETIAERIRAKIADEKFIIDRISHSLTISGGCAQLADFESAADFIRRVDAALYSAKRNGRNNIVRAIEAKDVGS